MSTKLRPFSTTFLGLASATLLAGCASLGSTAPETVTVTESVPSADSEAKRGADEDSQPQSQPETQSAATFDRNSPDFEFFNICEELTDEDLAKVELRFLDLESRVDPRAPSSTCSFEPVNGFDDSNGIQTGFVSMDGLSSAEVSENVRFIDSGMSSNLPNVRTFVLKGEGNDSCDADIPTPHGRLMVTRGSLRIGGDSVENHCISAIEYLEKFYEIVIGKQ